MKDKEKSQKKSKEVQTKARFCDGIQSSLL